MTMQVLQLPNLVDLAKQAQRQQKVTDLFLPSTLWIFVDFLMIQVLKYVIGKCADPSLIVKKEINEKMSFFTEISFL